MAHWTEELKDENRRLKDEVAALRAGTVMTVASPPPLDVRAFYERYVTHWATTDRTMLDPDAIVSLRAAAAQSWLAIEDLVTNHERIVAEELARRAEKARDEKRRAIERETQQKIQEERRKKAVTSPVVKIERSGVYTPDEQAAIAAAVAAGIGAPASPQVDIPAPVA